MSLIADNRRAVLKAPPKNRLAPYLWTFTIVVGVALFIYSGAAWVFFRPVLHKPLINKYAAQYKFDPLWVMALIRVESRFASSAESHKGAIGLMQLMPTTAQQLATELGMPALSENDLKIPDTNLRLGCYYLSKLSAMFPEDEVALLSAYNAGPGITQQWRRGKPALYVDDIEYPETRRFVRQVTKTYTLLKTLQRSKHLFGIDYEQPS